MDAQTQDNRKEFDMRANALYQAVDLVKCGKIGVEKTVELAKEFYEFLSK